MKSTRESPAELKEHYSYVTRRIIHLLGIGALDNVDYVDVEPDYGYFTRIVYRGGQTRVTYGNDLGLNPGASEDLAKDKGHTKFLLREMGINCPEGREFLLPWWIEKIGKRQNERGNTQLRDVSQIFPYIEDTFGYPCYIKPVNGSKGSGVYKASSHTDVEAAIYEYETNRVPVAIVEEPLYMPDYRLVLLDGELISAYRRDPLSITGDGVSCIAELIERKHSEFLDEGRDTTIDTKEQPFLKALQSRGLSLQSIPENGHLVVLSDVSNLSKGGMSLDYTEMVDKRWVELSGKIATGMNLRLCGVDLACDEITAPDSDYSVIEVNSSPGLDHFALSGQKQQQLVDDLYTKVLNNP